MKDASEIIKVEIERDGIISVSRFMELALYHSEYGYYRRSRDPFGIKGDFYTAGQLQPVFGELLAAYAAELQSSDFQESTFSVLEMGSGRGELRSSLSRWNYLGYDWSGDALPSSMQGLIIANEFFDALPVDLLIRTERQWRELGVAIRNERFVLQDMRPPEQALNEFARRYGSAVCSGGRLEVNLQAAEWLKKLAKLQAGGKLLIIDYGYSAAELDRFAEGTLMAYRRHHADPDFVVNPGCQDITAHVNFSYLRDLAVESGYSVEADCSLAYWMHRVWGEKEFSARWEEADQRWRMQWKHLFFGLGATFRVLELRRMNRK